MTPPQDRGGDEEASLGEGSNAQPAAPPTRGPHGPRPEPEDLTKYLSETEDGDLFDQYELTDLKGVGPARAQALREAGFDLERLVDADPEDVAAVEGIGIPTAKELIGLVQSLARQNLETPASGTPAGTPQALEDATLAALDRGIIQDAELEQAILENLTARLQLSDLEGDELKATVLEGLREPFNDADLEDAFLQAVEAELTAAKPEPEQVPDEAPSKTPSGEEDASLEQEAPASASGTEPGPAEEPLEDGDRPRETEEESKEEALTADAIEDAVLMALQEQRLEDPALESALLDALAAALQDTDADPGREQVVLDRLQAQIDDASVADNLRDRIEQAFDAKRAARPPPEPEDTPDGEDGEGDPAEGLGDELDAADMNGQGHEEAAKPPLKDGLDASEIEDAVLMALQAIQIDDPALEGALLDAMEAGLAEAEDEAGLVEAVLDRLQAQIDDPALADQLTARVQAELDATRKPHAGAEEQAEVPELEELEEIEELEDLEEIEDEGEGDHGVEVLDDLKVEPQEGMPDLQEFHEPEARDEPDRTRSAPQTADRETQELVDEISKEQERRIEARRAEAKELEERAKELEKKAEEEEKARKEFERHARYVEEIAPDLGLDPNRPITEIPDLEGTNFEEVEFSTIQEDYAYIRIVYHEDASRYLYQVLEPELNDTEQEVFEFLQDTLVRTMDGRRADETQDWDAYLEQEIERAILDHSILVDRVGKERLTYHLKRDFLGYGPIDVIMQDSMIEDISCDGPGIPVYVYHRQYESIRTNVVFEDEAELDSFVIRLAQRSGKHISIADPLLDATLPDTSRLQATLSREVTTRGSSFTIRKFRADPLTAPDLIRLGTLSSRMAAFLWIAMEDGAPMIMAGGTASGKTTTLNAMSQYIPPEKKVVSIEDTREINLIHENWIAGLTRSGFAGREGEGSIDMYRLLEAALRQRPEYLLVGEVRGPEAQTLFQAMATGHATYSTLHADSVRSAVYRLENPPIDVPRMMLQTLDAIAVQTQARVEKRSVRRIREFTEIVGIDSRTGDLLTNQVYDWDPDTDTYEYLGKSHILERRMEQNNLSPKEIEEDWSNRTLVLDWMVDKGIRHIEDVSNVIAAYYARPEAVMKRVRAAMDPEDMEELAPENLSEELA